MFILFTNFLTCPTMSSSEEDLVVVFESCGHVVCIEDGDLQGEMGRESNTTK